MKKLVGIRFFYSYKGNDEKGKPISYGNGECTSEEVADTSIFKFLLKKAKEYNSDVVSVNVVALTPLEFIVIE